MRRKKDCSWLQFPPLNVPQLLKRISLFITAAFLLTVTIVAGCSGSPSASPPSTAQAVSPIQGYEISGTVQDGGDTTPPDLLDAPRKFVYTVRTEDGLIVTMTYTAYPPSPNQVDKKIKLTFHAGAILIGDYVKARGIYDAQTRTLMITEEGDYIETFASKP